MAKDFLNDANDDLAIAKGDFVIGESTMTEVGVILRLNQGNLRHDPIMGPNLVTKIRVPLKKDELEQRVRLHLKRDDKDYNEIKKQIKFNTGG